MALLFELQRRGGATAAELADALEVSVRTTYRDVAALQSAGVPLWTEPGPHGGIRLLEGWRTSLDGLTGDEAAALFLAGAPGAVADLGLGSVLAAGRAKLLSTLPDDLRARAGRITERLHVDAPGWFQHDDDTTHLDTVAGALWADHRLDVRYRRGEQSVARRLDPLGLVQKAGTWYLVARHRGDVRTYRVSRIVAATDRGERFVRPDGFDLASWWAESSREFDRSLLRVTVRLRLSPGALRWLRHLVDPGVADEVAAEAGPPDGEGWRAVELPVESLEVAASQLVGLGAGVEVLAPAELRRALHATGRALAERNRPGGEGVAVPPPVGPS